MAAEDQHQHHGVDGSARCGNVMGGKSSSGDGDENVEDRERCNSVGYTNTGM